MTKQNELLDYPNSDEVAARREKFRFLKTFNICYILLILGIFFFDSTPMVYYFLIPSVFLFPVVFLLNVLIHHWDDSDTKPLRFRLFAGFIIFVFLLMESVLILLTLLLIGLSGFEGFGSN